MLLHQLVRVYRAAATGYPRQRFSALSSLSWNGSGYRRDVTLQEDGAPNSKPLHHRASSTLYIGNLPATAKVELIRSKLEDLGVSDYIKDVRLLNEFRKRRIAFGFVHCDSPEHAQLVMDVIPKDWRILGHNVVVEFSKPDTREEVRRKMDYSKVMYIGGLDGSVVKEDIETALEESGIRGDWNIVMPRRELIEGDKPWYAITDFETSRDAHAAHALIRKYGGLFIHGKKAIVTLHTNDKQKVAVKAPNERLQIPPALVVRFVDISRNSDESEKSRVRASREMEEDVHELLGDLTPKKFQELRPRSPEGNESEPDSESGTNTKLRPELMLEFENSDGAFKALAKLNGAMTSRGLAVVAQFYRKPNRRD
ncbi:hypothetical protein EW145_g7710 [Phellinidium pouzarii]|uniref:RRM domain-containing protein n=1 Tax=Phellinidium pouzarii TaxID=167371 RepID=A0A4S4KF91_9AGAM|nr:hypothetical protein EW145_g7710 [Phellinidium pouzarii]